MSRRFPDAATITRLGRRLRLAFNDARSSPSEDPEEPLAAPLAPQVEFVAYTEDCLISGHIRLNTDRLTDLLNAHDEYELLDVMVMDLAEARSVATRHIVVSREEILAVHAMGPRGDTAKRQRVRPHALALQSGPYHVRGYLHALPGADPLSSIRRRRPMVPFTEAWIDYLSGEVRQRRRVGTLVVNRELIDWVATVADEQVELPDLPVETDKGPLLKDFTGQILLGDQG